MDSELFDRFLGLTKFSGDTKAQYFSSKDNLIQQKWLCEEDVEDSMLLMVRHCMKQEAVTLACRINRILSRISRI